MTTSLNINTFFLLVLTVNRTKEQISPSLIREGNQIFSQKRKYSLEAELGAIYTNFSNKHTYNELKNRSHITSPYNIIITSKMLMKMMSLIKKKKNSDLKEKSKWMPFICFCLFTCLFVF